ncbi:hypothetical protein K523DRAFT_422106 [Schizophyllum commune Tattone D]|nr:hypothetical protein K523DRAFT_422106 [Schizophyllum commune Tattone D]
MVGDAGSTTFDRGQYDVRSRAEGSQSSYIPTLTLNPPHPSTLLTITLTSVRKHPSYLRPSPPTTPHHHTSPHPTTHTPTPNAHSAFVNTQAMPPVKTASVKAGSAEPREEEGEASTSSTLAPSSSTLNAAGGSGVGSSGSQTSSILKERRFKLSRACDRCR